MKFFEAFVLVAVTAAISAVHLVDPYTAEAPERVPEYRVLAESDVRPTAVALLLTNSTGREEVSRIVQDYASRYPEAEAVSIRVVDEYQEAVARVYYCFDISGAGTTGLSPGERRFEYGAELEEERDPLMH